MTEVPFEHLLSLIIGQILPATALILSVINGAILFSNYMRDKPKLEVSPVHPDIYQCWVRLKDIEKDNVISRRYAFISYFSVANSGVRDAAVNEWRLHIKNRLRLVKRWHKKKELMPYNIPEPQCIIGDHVKLIRAFGQNTPNFQSDSNMVKSGDSISGIACWMYSVWGGEGWSPKTDKHNNITGILKISNVFGKKSQCKIYFRELTIEQLKKMIPSIGEYLEKGDFLL